MPIIVEEVSVEAIPDAAQRSPGAAQTESDAKSGQDGTPVIDLSRRLRWLRERAERVHAH